jgi:hypothetical protein
MHKQLYGSVTSTTGLIRINVSQSHGASTANAVVEAIDTDLEVGDTILIDLGYSDDHGIVFSGYVKNVEWSEPERKVTISANDVLIRAADYFLVSADPEAPFSRQNILVTHLAQELLAVCGLNSFVHDDGYFLTLAIRNPVEINLTSIFDYCSFLADLVAYNMYADIAGTIHFVDRKPHPTDDDVSITTLNRGDLTEVNYSVTDRDLRNRIVVYGSAGIFAEAKVRSPYLPDNPDGSPFYKTVCFAASGLLDSYEDALLTAEYNLAKLNRLTRSGQVTTIGNYILQARQCITVVNSEMGMAGKWYIYSLDHSWSRSGYTCSMDLRK